MLWNTEATAWTLPSSPFNVHKLTCHKHLTHQQADGWEDGSVFLDGLKTNNPGINSHGAASVITVLKSKVSFLTLTYFMYITSPGSRITCQQLTSQQSTDTSDYPIGRWRERQFKSQQWTFFWTPGDCSRCFCGVILRRPADISIFFLWQWKISYFSQEESDRLHPWSWKPKQVS